MIELLFNHLRFYVVVVMDFDEKRGKNETRPFIPLYFKGSWLTTFNTSECCRTEAAWTRITLPVFCCGPNSEVVKE
jgi:hypothetical protein